MNDSGSIAIANVVIDQNLPGVFGAKLFGIRVVVEQALVANSPEL